MMKGWRILVGAFVILGVTVVGQDDAERIAYGTENLRRSIVILRIKQLLIQMNQTQ
ncbi:hypothetical protein IGI39_004407 [Enterococcus sp. AZ135]|uniref:hypothetical protein n=1 Tax=unclassified Enterococcus TaxID=2608891 RepID=UPI003F258499